MFFKRSPKVEIDWNILSSVDDIERINDASKEKPVLIFKHSRTCSISGAALGRLVRNWEEGHKEQLSLYMLDILSNRDISNAIAQSYGVQHESPQAILIKDGKAVYANSHFGISLDDFLTEAQSA